MKPELMGHPLKCDLYILWAVAGSSTVAIPVRETLYVDVDLLWTHSVSLNANLQSSTLHSLHESSLCCARKTCFLDNSPKQTAAHYCSCCNILQDHIILVFDWRLVRSDLREYTVLLFLLQKLIHWFCYFLAVLSVISGYIEEILFFFYFHLTKFCKI